MKDIFYEDRIIPSASIKCIEVRSDIHEKVFSIMVRQVGDNYTLFSCEDKELVFAVFNKLKEQCDGISFDNVLKETFDEASKKRIIELEQQKPKTRKRKVSDKNDRKE